MTRIERMRCATMIWFARRWRSCVIGILVAAHIAAFVVAWFLAMRIGGEWYAVAIFSLWTSDACLLALWCGLGHAPLVWRLFGSHLGLDLLLLTSFFAGFLNSELLVIFLLLVAWPALFVFTSAIAVRLMGISVTLLLATDTDIHEHGKLQVSLLNLMAIVGILSLLVAAWVVVNDYLKFIALNARDWRVVLTIALTMATCWAAVCLTLSTWRLRWRFVNLLIVVALSVANHSMWDGVAGLLMKPGLVPAIVSASLLVVRLCGYRIVVNNRHAAAAAA